MADSENAAQQNDSKSGKLKRLTLQERLALAAKTKKKLASGSTVENNTPHSESSDIPSTPAPADLIAINTPLETVSESNKSTASDESTACDKNPADVSAIELPNPNQTDETIHREAAKDSPEKIESSIEVEHSIDRLDDPIGEPQDVLLSKNETPEIAEQPPKSEKTVVQTATPPKDKTLEDCAADSPNLIASEVTKKHEEEVQQLKMELEELKGVVDSKTKEISSLKKSNVPSNLEKKLQEKENIIQQLMIEGQELSGKEVKQNERIRGLIAHNKELESSLKNYADKNEQCLLKIGEIEDAIKFHNYKSLDQLLDAMAKSSQKILELQSSAQREKKLNWEGKYKELQKLYENALEELRGSRKEVNEKSVQLELLQKLSQLELESKDEIISKLSQEVIVAKNEASEELSRLESKVEQLRSENESFLKTSHKEAEASEDSSRSRKIDYQDYARLSSSNQQLQEQFLLSQENWRTIELDLRFKLEKLESTVDTLKKSKAKASAELSKAFSQISEQTQQIASLKKEAARLSELDVDNTFKLKMKASECADLEEELNKLKLSYEAEKANLEMKIQTLLESITSLQNPPSFPPSVSSESIPLQSRKPSLEHFHAMRSDMRPPTRLHSLNSLNFQLNPNLALSTPLVGWEEETFSQNQFSYSQEGVNFNNSNFVNSEIYPQDAADSGSDAAPVRSTSGATKNIQLISKMSSNIRRLEMDILSLKEENEELSRNKEQAQQEILGLLEVQSTVKELSTKTEQLENALREKARNEETLLQVIGEKSERVEELQADVVDLKDLMRQQVQQMIEMQSQAKN